MIVRPVGAHALLVEVGDARTALALARLIRDRTTDGGLPAAMDVVPAARTVLLAGLPSRIAVGAWRELLDALVPDEVVIDAVGPTREIVVDTTYDGPDLAVVATAWGCSPEAVAERHQHLEYLVAFCGFAPGFAYCLSADRLPEVPRREVPRERVPAGAVALGGEYCGIYPRAMPGGWQLLGRTDAVLFDVDHDPPALLAPGDRVRFRSVS